MIIESVPNKEMTTHPEVIDILSEILPDGISTDIATKHMSSSDVSVFKMVGKDNNIIGFFTYEDCEYKGRKECHAYFFHSQRKHSVEALKALIAFVKEQGFDVYTTVTGTYPHVKRILGMIGFSTVKVDKDAFTKEGISYPLYHLIN